MAALLQHPRVSTVVAHQCMFGLVTKDKSGRECLAKKPTMFASSSVHMLKQLGRVCSKDHEHALLMDGKAKAAAFYPKALVKAILRGIRDTADAEEREQHEEERAPEVVAATLKAQLVDPDPSLKSETLSDLKTHELQSKHL